jgi:glycosyltransferase involved in cell wall biosynthesis
MNIGFVNNWCNRGQGVVARWVRTIFDEAGHNTYVLARPTNPKAPIGSYIDERDDWATENVTFGSAFEMPVKEYVHWAKTCNLDVLFCDMNLQFEAVQAVRQLGVKTIGRFVWERFGRAFVDDANAAYDVIYSLTKCEKEAYRKLGINSPSVRFGLHPSISEYTAAKKDDAIYFIFHGGLQGKRKPIKATVDAFKTVKNPNIRLVIKSQGVRDESEPVEIDDDQRIQYIVEDMDDESYHELFSSCHVCLSPSRWEGLGVHLYESIAHGMPVISNDIPPINEVITSGKTGILVNSVPLYSLSNGLVVYDPEPDDLVAAISKLSDPVTLQEITASTRIAAQSDRFDWNNTKEDYLALITKEKDNSSSKKTDLLKKLLGFNN